MTVCADRKAWKRDRKTNGIGRLGVGWGIEGSCIGTLYMQS